MKPPYPKAPNVPAPKKYISPWKNRKNLRDVHYYLLETSLHIISNLCTLHDVPFL